jgi:2-hydroxychromene-2-carboxylate isomerase
LHFSFRSPFTWMAVTVLLRRVPDAMARLELLPYWDPDAQTRAALDARGALFHYAQMSKAKHLYILHDTKRQAQRLGLRMVWPVDDDPWWELPHLAWLAARRLGRGPELYHEVMAARWERGEDICAPEVIGRLAARVGIDARVLAGAPAVPEIRAEGVDCLVAAYEDDIFGVPYFRLGRHRYWGLDRVEDFIAELISTVDGRPPPAAVSPVPDALGERLSALDIDTAGGCG